MGLIPMILKEKYLLPLGVLCLAFALLIDRFMPVDWPTDFLVGVLSGMSVALNIAGIYKAGKKI
ncbi:MAG: hypothetical protein P1Q69_16840 [Candidatus Thorarchaeota archaeon]|nr:hypothetical protein [Candidatus Thorarchaeota archaeon]